jgi:hypothetical protein
MVDRPFETARGVIGLDGLRQRPLEEFLESRGSPPSGRKPGDPAWSKADDPGSKAGLEARVQFIER